MNNMKYATREFNHYLALLASGRQWRWTRDNEAEIVAAVEFIVREAVVRVGEMYETRITELETEIRKLQRPGASDWLAEGIVPD